MGGQEVDGRVVELERATVDAPTTPDHALAEAGRVLAAGQGAGAIGFSLCLAPAEPSRSGVGDEDDLPADASGLEQLVGPARLGERSRSATTGLIVPCASRSSSPGQRGSVQAVVGGGSGPDVGDHRRPLGVGNGAEAEHHGYAYRPVSTPRRFVAAARSHTAARRRGGPDTTVISGAARRPCDNNVEPPPVRPRILARKSSER